MYKSYLKIKYVIYTRYKNMSISHKKINEIKNKIDDFFLDSSDTQKNLFLTEVKKILKYDEENGSYSKEYYEKYRKQYYEKNKEKLNKKRVENAKKIKFEN